MRRSRRLTEIAAALERIGGGAPRMVLPPKQARQFIFPSGIILRFDLAPGQYSARQQPHIKYWYGRAVEENPSVRLDSIAARKRLGALTIDDLVGPQAQVAE